MAKDEETKVKDVAGEGKGLGTFYKGKAKDYKMIIPIEPPKPVKKSGGGLIRGTGAAVKGTNFKGIF